jgi:hypothetical protein
MGGEMTQGVAMAQTKMKRWFSGWRMAWVALLLAGWAGGMPLASASAGRPPSAAAEMAPLPDSRQIESDLQHLPWPRFRTVIEAIPKMKAQIDAYGPLGWNYVRTNYRTHHWKKNIDRLEPDQRRQLVELIRKAQVR